MKDLLKVPVHIFGGRSFEDHPTFPYIQIEKHSTGRKRGGYTTPTESTVAPLLRRMAITSGRLARAAKCRAVSPVDVAASGFAPCWIREVTTFVCPIKDAICSGVRPTWKKFI